MPYARVSILFVLVYIYNMGCFSYHPGFVLLTPI